MSLALKETNVQKLYSALSQSNTHKICQMDIIWFETPTSQFRSCREELKKQHCVTLLLNPKDDFFLFFLVS